MNECDNTLLTSIYQNTCTAIQSIENILPACKNANLKKKLMSELDTYVNLREEYQSYKKSGELDDNSWFEKARLWTSIKMTTLTDKSTRHIAEMMLLGTVMGTLQCYKDLCDCPNASEGVRELCTKLLGIEENHFNELKRYLKTMKRED